ncbi:MAG: sigma-70 family RNA polymerase sigma factor [Bacteroidetes bacterium]|nr:sigma-70 family RNA polymerase sigma factor [Bacteroidota bacterium]
MNCLKNFNDHELVLLFRNGNSSALSILAERHKKRVFTAIIILVKDYHTAEDIFQELFMRITDTITKGKYNEEGKFLPWVLRIAHNMCIDYLRKSRTNCFIKHTDKTDVFERISTPEPAADNRLLTLQTKEKITAMLNLLPEEQREVVVLRHYSDMSFKQIAAQTNCSLNTALGRMRYAMINLRKLINDHQVVL